MPIFLALAVWIGAALCGQTPRGDISSPAPLLIDYRPILGLFRAEGSPDGRTEIALRSWTEAGRSRLLLADPATLHTRVTDGAAPPSLSWVDVEKVFSANGSRAPYFRLRDAARATREKTANSGVASWRAAQRGVWLSVDLCPSKKPLDRWIFTELTGDRRSPLPVFLDVSGRWIADHGDDFAWLIALESAGHMDVAWVGHGEEHPYDPRVPYTRTFDLTPGLDFSAEVFKTEKRLIAAGRSPSVWYRFPGLISSPALVDTLLSWGLIPLGSGAWLNKNESPRDGDVVLVHANGNEERGLRLLERLAKDRREALAAGRWSWLGQSDF